MQWHKVRVENVQFFWWKEPEEKKNIPSAMCTSHRINQLFKTELSMQTGQFLVKHKRLAGEWKTTEWWTATRDNGGLNRCTLSTHHDVEESRRIKKHATTSQKQHAHLIVDRRRHNVRRWHGGRQSASHPGNKQAMTDAVHVEISNQAGWRVLQHHTQIHREKEVHIQNVRLQVSRIK